MLWPVRDHRIAKSEFPKFPDARLRMDSGIRKMIKGLLRLYGVFVFNFLVHLENRYQGKALEHFNNSRWSMSTRNVGGRVRCSHCLRRRCSRCLRNRCSGSLRASSSSQGLRGFRSVIHCRSRRKTIEKIWNFHWGWEDSFCRVRTIIWRTRRCRIQRHHT